MRTMYHGTEVPGPPTLTGVAGRAWRVTLPALGERARPDHDATLGGFLVHVPGAHICWDHWMVSAVHLRPIPGVTPAHKRFDAATHEFVIAALDPTSPLPASLVVDRDWHLALLKPIDVIEQFVAVNDAVADCILELAVRTLVDGLASPDQDWRPWWTQAIASTATHFRDGTHGVELQ